MYVVTMENSIQQEVQECTPHQVYPGVRNHRAIIPSLEEDLKNQSTECASTLSSRGDNKALKKP